MSIGLDVSALHEVNSESGSNQGTYYCKFLHNQVAAAEEENIREQKNR
jgi:hypothetical protein